MAGALETITGSRKFLGDRDYSVDSLVQTTQYTTFAEMYLERPVDTQTAKASCTVCTWRGIPTIDDW